MNFRTGILEVLVKNPTELKGFENQGPDFKPVWNLKVNFSEVTANSVLKLEFFNSSALQQNSAFDSSLIPLNKVVESGIEEISLPVISSKGKQKGFVHLLLKFTPWNPALISKETKKSRKPKKSNWILPKYAHFDAWKDYEPGVMLGKGTFGTTYSAIDRVTKEAVAIKVISKRKLVTAEEIEDARREIQIMFHLAGHANVVQLRGRGAYEDKAHICLVMEQCTGGELFEAIARRGRLTKRSAAEHIRTIVSVVAHCHSMGVIHRDLKPENFLFSHRGADAQLKAIDFGYSCFFAEGQQFTDIVGSPHYVAPEVLNGQGYSKEADIWSCGIILYILLCGYPPFAGVNEKQIFDAVMNEPLSFLKEPWPRISDAAKDCVRQMLVRNPKKRASAPQILNHEYLRENGVALSEPAHTEVLQRLERFSNMNRLKKEALKVIALHLNEDEITGMRSIFRGIDVDNTGVITIEKLLSALRKQGNLIKESDVADLIKKADINGDGTIDYEEFLAATLHRCKLDREECLKIAFEYFDANHDGQITKEELGTALSGLGCVGIEDILREVDADNSDTIDYNEFCAMMRGF